MRAAGSGGMVMAESEGQSGGLSAALLVGASVGLYGYFKKRGWL